MCTWVEVDGEICTDQCELMDTLGTADLVPVEGATIRMRDCLCTVDLEATAARHGYRLERGWTEDCACDWRMVHNG